VPQRSRSALRLVLLTGGLATLLSAPLQSQSAPSDINGTRVFQANARIVVLDVVVTGKNQRPLTGLHQQDFVLSEDGHPQTISYFEEHTGAQPLQVNPPNPAPNIFTNIPRIKPSDSVTVLLFDSLNTPLDDQRFVREQMLRYLKKPDLGRRIAVFALGTQLLLLHNFTDDPALLAAAINNRKNGAAPGISPLLQSNAETAATQETIDALMPYAPDAAADMKQFAAEQDSQRGQTRIRLTLEALQELAHYLAAIPGRKNVAWFSGAFPLAIFPDSSLPQEFGAQRDDQEEVHKTDALLAAAQVAIYPIAAEGVAVDSSYSAGADPRVAQQQISNPHQDTQQRNANHAAMDLIAKDTGGEAFYGTNSLTDALDHATDHGSHFYTLTYTSTNPATNGKFRKIQVTLAHSGYQLAYRRGYYADDKKSVQAAAAQPAPKPVIEPLSRFLRPGVPESTQIPLTLRVTRSAAPPRAAPASTSGHPPAGNPGQGGDNPNLQGPLTRYSVDLMIPARALLWDPAPDGHHRVSLEAALVVYNREGKAVNWILRQIKLNPDAAHYATAQTTGVNLFLEIDAPDKEVSLRGGVYDLNANLAGTVHIPLSAVVSSAAATRSK
jgi:VWFA-related protein